MAREVWSCSTVVVDEAVEWAAGATPIMNGCSAAPIDHLAEARRERELGEAAALVLEESIEAARVLFGDPLADALTRRVDRASGVSVACDRYERAIAERDARVERLEAELTQTALRCRVLSDTLTAEMNRRAEETATALAALACLQGAYRWAKARTRKKTRPGWMVASGELLDKLEVGR
jgi:hypothetical protein